VQRLAIGLALFGNGNLVDDHQGDWSDSVAVPGCDCLAARLHVDRCPGPGSNSGDDSVVMVGGDNYGVADPGLLAQGVFDGGQRNLTGPAKI
jgi:hypothetical protein